MDTNRILGANPSMPVYIKADRSAPAVSDSWTEFMMGLYEVGYEGDAFTYDNEYPYYKQYLQQFSIRDNSVSCVEFIEFIEFIDTGGYANPTLWLSQGWDWLQQNNAALLV